MTADVVAALVRHALTGVGGALALRYGVDGAAMEAIIGGAAALAGVLWSLYDKRRRA
jgi:hypothetical protein